MTNPATFSTEIIGTSLPIRKELEFIRKVAKSDRNILVLGETGTGKEIVARKIHELSDRCIMPFVAINTADIPEELFEAELYGFERGAFTGAIKEKRGLLEVAQSGTVFLDEIGDLSFNLQAKLLRVIDQKEVRRVGDINTRIISARFIFATNKDLKSEVKLGRFRRDLYFRIGVVKFWTTPLRERKEDIPLLALHFLEKENKRGLIKKDISPGALKKVMTYHFPGNIRELENIIQRACILSDNDRIEDQDIWFDNELSNGYSDREFSEERLRLVLEQCQWNKSRAAIVLGTSRRQFYRLLKKFQMINYIKKI